MMDEPTVGIDPQARAQDSRRGARRSPASGTTVLYTTHYLEEAEELCHRIGIMDHGKILAEGNLDELMSMSRRGADLVTLRGKFLDPDCRAASSLAGHRG